ncbi:SET domain-containing protein [Lindgomyces ingoldianus]|uniref:SET domain-containing protein n=1 Tax=Lindgomyces ingoldianus TaxID=673940 RepID=A0ACB6QSU1_9PLEO|nr:SET domain-containing protein [Lindgomyces ingoldianus]KAF2469907.1 SET domain-containing protein [Lindgomyces ingoldianus]
MNTHDDLLHWALAKGVQSNGILLQAICGRGVGIVAARPLEAGEVLLTVPAEAFRTLHTVPKHISRKLPRDISLHALLATWLALDNRSDFAPWNTMFPTLPDFEAGTPLLWPEELQDLLPKPAKDILRKQQFKFQRDWDIVSKTFPDISREKYLYSWLLVNSRSFYYTTPRMEKLPHDDRLALMPLADLFNHADSGIETSFSRQSYTFTTDRAYREGEEIHVSYGGHSNDFLLAEYGFVLAENQFDAVYLDELILPRLNKEQEDALKDKAFLGNYTLDRETPGCFRTQVALRIFCCTRKEWERFTDAEVDSERSQRRVNVLLVQLLGRFVGEIHQTLGEIEKLNVGLECQRKLLAQRWKQIETMVTQTLKRLSN